jgi:cytochrome P450
VKTPPTPSEHPLVQKVRYMRDPLGYLLECQAKLGDIFMLQVMKQGMVIVCSPDLTKAVYMQADDTLVAGEAKLAVFGKILGQTSTLLLDGPEHLKRRRLMLPRFRGELMQSFRPVMVEAARKTLDDMPRDRAFALHPYMHQTAFEVILRALFAETPIARMHHLRSKLHAFANKAVTSPLLRFQALQRDFGQLSPWGRVQQIVRDARDAVLAEVQRRRRHNVEAKDITGLLTAARHDDDSPLSDIEVRDEIMTMVAAGHETTSMAMTWLCKSVFTEAGVYDKLIAERAANPDKSVDELPYLDAVVKESLRLNSLIPSGSGRIAKKTFELGGYNVRAGSMVSVAFHAIHRRPELFDRPNEFVPERFMSGKYSPYENVPFGGGTRRCIGMPFALYEMKLVLSTLLETMRLEIVQSPVKPMWRGMFLTPNKGLTVRVRPRVVRTDDPARAAPAPLRA